jgi:hypothetical protein
VNVTLLLCDAAQVAGGKLFVLGGGWNTLVTTSDDALSMALAILVVVPWHETNQRHRLRSDLLTEDGAPVGGDAPVFVDGEFEMGRPPGTKPGTSLNVPFAVNVSTVLPAGGYRWQVSIDGTTMAEASFNVVRASRSG